MILRGTMSLKLEKLGDAQEVFERVVKTLDPQDVYSHVALGNIYFTVAADAAKFKRGGEDTTAKELKYQVMRLQTACLQLWGEYARCAQIHHALRCRNTR